MREIIVTGVVISLLCLFCVSLFQELVGPSDWENHSHGKEGAERYKVHNLPNDTGPGLYELGIAVPGAGVIVVYVGQAESVRARLQAYGRTGAHLNSGSDSGRYFEDIFRRGYSIVYRSAPVSEFFCFNIFGSICLVDRRGINSRREILEVCMEIVK